MKETFKKIGQKLKQIGKEIYWFASSQIFLKNFGGMVAFIALLIFFTFWWMRCFTNHGESLHVDDYTGIQLEDAITNAESRSFTIVVNDSSYRKGMEPGMVLAQNPAPHAQVKENRKIYLSISKQPDNVFVPVLEGSNESFHAYSRDCERAGFEIEEIGSVFNSKLESNTVVEVVFKKDTLTQQLKKGVRLPEGSTLGVIVTKRSGGTVPIPNLVCKQFDAASFLVGNYNLNIGSVIRDATVTNEGTAYVWQQTPRYSGSGRMRIGEQIDIYLTQRLPENCRSGESIETPTTEGTEQ